VAQYFPITFFAAYMLAVFVWPTVRTYRNTGVSPVTFGRADTAHDYIGRAFKVVLFLIPVSHVFFYGGEQLYSYLLPARYLEHLPLKLAGITLCLLSLCWTIVAQWQMGNSWRIGIDEKTPAALVTNGVFSRSRNPVFLGMIVTSLGVFLLQPNAVTLLTITSAYLLIQVQVRLEEVFLMQQHGRDYAHYMDTVPRFLSLTCKF